MDTIESAALGNEVTQAQLEAHWMPFTGNRQFKSAPRLFVGAQGCHYGDARGRKIFDGLSGCGIAGWATAARRSPTR